MERSPSRLIFEHSSYYNSQDMPFTFLDGLIRLLLFRLPRLPSDPSVYTFPVALKNEGDKEGRGPALFDAI